MTQKPDRRGFKSRLFEWLFTQGYGAVVGAGLLYAAYQLVPKMIEEQRKNNERIAVEDRQARQEEAVRNQQNIERMMRSFDLDKERDERRFRDLFDRVVGAPSSLSGDDLATGDGL